MTSSSGTTGIFTADASVTAGGREGSSDTAGGVGNGIAGGGVGPSLLHAAQTKTAISARFMPSTVAYARGPYRARIARTVTKSLALGFVRPRHLLYVAPGDFPRALHHPGERAIQPRRLL